MTMRIDIMGVLKDVWNTVCRKENRQTVLAVLAALMALSLITSGVHRIKEQRQAIEAEADQVAETVIVEPTPEPVKEPEIPQSYIDEAEALARVIYGIRDNSESDMRTHIWCILNRVDNKAGEFAGADTLEKVIGKPGQWIFYDESYGYPVVESLYQIALEEVMAWHDGHRPCSADYVYEEWSREEIVLRSTWEYGKDTKTWRYDE